MAVNLPEVLDSSTMNPVRILHPSEASASLSILSVSSAELTVLIEEKVEFGDWVKMYYPNGKSGIFRAGNPVFDYDKGTESAGLTHGCTTLADSIVTEGYEEDSSGNSKTTYFEGSASYVINKLLGYQKAPSHWKIGTVESSDKVKIEVKYQDILTLLNDVMDQLNGYYLDYDQTQYPWKVHVRKTPTEVTSEGRLSRNVTSAQITFDDSELITRLYCNALPDGHIDSKNINKFGIREGFYYIADNTESSWVKNACETYLRNRDNPDITVSIEGADFSRITGVTLDKVLLGDLYRLAIPKYNMTVEEQITELSYYDLYNREFDCKITLGKHLLDLSSALAETTSTSSSASTSASAANANVNKAWSKFVGEIEETNTLIQQTEERLRLYASDLVNGLTAELDITAQRIRSSISNLETGFSSYITQTAERIRAEVRNEVLGLQSSLTVTANAITSRVNDYNQDMEGRFTVTASRIEAKVSKNEVATSLALEVGNVIIEGGNLIVKGLVTAEAVKTAFANIQNVTGQSITVNSAYIKNTSGNKVNVGNGFQSVTKEATDNTNEVKLKFTRMSGSDPVYVTFNKAVNISGSWSDGVYTAAPNSSSTSTTASTTLSDRLLNPQYTENTNKITGYIAYKGLFQVPVSTGMLVEVNAQEAYAAGQRSVGQASTTEEWNLGVYSVKNQNGNVIRSTTLNSIEVIGNTHQPANKRNLVQAKISSDDGATGYQPSFYVDTTDAWVEGWHDYYDSNLWEAISKGHLTVKRPKRAHNGQNENWFKVSIGSESWATAPAKVGVSNTLSYNLLKDESVVATNKVDFELTEDAGYVFAGAKGKDDQKSKMIMKIQPQNIPLTDWGLTPASDGDSPTVSKTSKNVVFSMSCYMNGKKRTGTVTKTVTVSKVSGFSDKIQVKIGSTVVAYLNAP